MASFLFGGQRCAGDSFDSDQSTAEAPAWLGAVKGRCSLPAQQGEKLRTRVKIFQLYGQEAEGDYEIALAVPLG